MSALRIRPATLGDVDTIVEILIASKQASFPELLDAHDLDVRFWRRRWRGYVKHGSRARGSRGDGFVLLAEVDDHPVGYAAYHHTTRHGADAELQNSYVVRAAQNRGVGTALLAVVAERLAEDGTLTMCVGYDELNPYKRFYFKHGAVEIEPCWALWHDVRSLASRLQQPTSAAP